MFGIITPILMVIKIAHGSDIANDIWPKGARVGLNSALTYGPAFYLYAIGPPSSSSRLPMTKWGKVERGWREMNDLFSIRGASQKQGSCVAEVKAEAAESLGVPVPALPPRPTSNPLTSLGFSYPIYKIGVGRMNSMIYLFNCLKDTT